MYKVAIFDMDGTILDTIQDLADSMNHVMEKNGFSSKYKPEDMKLFFGSGVHVAVLRALAAESGLAEKEILEIGNVEHAEEKIDKNIASAIENDFNSWYPEHCNRKTGPFPGILKVLSELRKEGVMTAVVSNKMDDAVQVLVEKHFPELFACAQGVTVERRRKPYPDMTQYVMEQLGVKPEETVYIGDSEVDMETAKNTGIACISVDWGFRTHHFLKEIGAKTICSTVEEMKRCILD